MNNVVYPSIYQQLKIWKYIFHWGPVFFNFFSSISDNERNFYNIPDFITDTTTFENYVNAYAAPSYYSAQTGQSTISGFYRVIN